jgi:glycerate 2-kinase
VASGPTMRDKTTKKDAEKIIKKYLRESAYKSALIRVLKETPKDKKYFKKAKNILFLSNREPVLAMLKKAKSMNLKLKIHSLAVRGEAKNSLLPMIKKIKSGEAVLAAGETTVKLSKSFGAAQGKGGRNTEAVLGAIQNTKYNIQNTIIMSFASDGRDNTEAAGAIADLSTIKKAQKLNLDSNGYLNRRDSFNFFKKTGDLVFAKQKSFNVSDFMLVLSLPKE